MSFFQRFWSKNNNFSNFVFLGSIVQENVFYDILERKNAFLTYKNNKFKKSKNWHFSKGVNPWFWSKNGHFSNFVKKSKNWHFSKGVNPWFWSKNGHFSKFVFLGKIGQEHVFYDILERKNAFLSYKNKKFKKAKNWHFSKVVNPWVLSKNGRFSKFVFLGKIGQEHVFYDILDRIKAFLSYKNKKFKKAKNWHFSKGVNPWVFSKNGHFSKFVFLGKIVQENEF